MTDAQADQMINLLGDILTELRDLRFDFRQFTDQGTSKVNDVADQITGPLGYSLGDVHSKLDEVIFGLSSIENAIDLK